MKNNGLFFIPILIFLVISLLGNRLMASGAINPQMMIFLVPVVALVLIMFRPKKQAKKPITDVFETVMGDYAMNAFSDNEKLSARFQSALNDYSGNMPKSAISKLTKLAPECRTDQEKYAVAMASALCHVASQKYEDAIREYNKAVVIHPTSELAQTIGSLQQRMGELKKARESYDFALELDPSNIEARSAMATAWVASRKYENALEDALLALEQDENHASSLASAAICYGLTGQNELFAEYTDKAEANGYSRKKIEETVKALKK